MIITTLYHSKDLNEIIRMTERSDSTSRSKETWIGNELTAILSFDENKFCGILPLEKRKISLCPKKHLTTLWVTGAHVEPEYRSMGIGTIMDRDMSRLVDDDCKAVFVYRGDEKSRAYKWYRKLGYCDLVPILSFKQDIFRSCVSSENTVLLMPDEIYKWEDKLIDCFNRNNGVYGGFPERTNAYFTHKLSTHYYKDFYSYSILAVVHHDEISAYALLGRTSIRDDVDRIEIMDFSVPTDENIFNILYGAIMEYSISQGVEEIRIQLSVQDPFIEWIKQRGFTQRYRFNIMGKLFDSIKYLKDCLQESIDIETEWMVAIETPLLGYNTIGTGRKKITLYMDDCELNRILLRRTNIMNALEEGRIVILDGQLSDLEIIAKTFPPSRWRYFQLDYI